MPTLVLAAAGAGLASALLYATLLTGSFGAFVLAYLAQLPLFVIGLWMGFAGAAVAGLAAVAALAMAGGVAFALLYALVNAAPAVAMSYLAQLNRQTEKGDVEWLPPGMLVAWLVGIAMAAFVALVILLLGQPGGAEGTIRAFVEAALRQLAGAADAQAVGATAGMIARFFPGIVADSWMVMVMANGVLAQGLLVRMGRNRRPSPAMADLDLPSWLMGATAIAAIGSFLPPIAALLGFDIPHMAGFVGGNLVLMSVLAYALAGLAVVHAFAGRSPNRTLVLAATYGAVFIFGWPAVLLALLGAAEPWLNLRRRIGGGSGT